MIEFAEARSGTAARFWWTEESEGTVAGREAFEAEALIWYLKT